MGTNGAFTRHVWIVFSHILRLELFDTVQA